MTKRDPGLGIPNARNPAHPSAVDDNRHVGSLLVVTGRPVRDLRAAMPHLRTLLGILSNLRVVLLVGNKAAEGWRLLPAADRPDVPVLRCAHPSPRVKAAFPDKWAEIGPKFREVRDLLDTP